jgi:L-lactate utilization protein LutC
MSSREAFLQRVRQAVAEGNQAGSAAPLPMRGNVGYQGAGDDPVQRFCQELAAAGGAGHVVHATGVLAQIQAILQQHGAKRILLSSGGMVAQFGLADKLRAMGFEVCTSNDGQQATREEFFAADVGITNAYRLIAETGTVVVSSEPNEPRSASLLPPVHIALASRSQILPDLFDLFDLFSPTPTANQSLPPSCLSLITGPSKTGDIELKLVTGVHGPGEVHVLIFPE